MTLLLSPLCMWRNFRPYPLFDETFHHIELCNSVIGQIPQIRQNFSDSALSALAWPPVRQQAPSDKNCRIASVASLLSVLYSAAIGINLGGGFMRGRSVKTLRNRATQFIIFCSILSNQPTHTFTWHQFHRINKYIPLAEVLYKYVYM